MVLSINDPEGYRLAEVRQIRPNGLRGAGTYLLVLTVEMSVGPVRAATELHNLVLRVEIENDKGREVIGWGEVEDHGVVRLTQHTTHRQLSFLIQLSPHQLEAIESRRNGGDLKLSVWMFGEARQGAKMNGFAERSEYVLTQQEWLGALEKMGARRTLLFELALPSGDDSARTVLAEILTKAHSHLLKGHYDEVVGFCRQAVEYIEKRNDDKALVENAREKYRSNRESMDVAERLLFLREVLKNVTHLGSHYCDKPGFSRQQAHAVLGMTVALLSADSGKFI